MADRAAESLAYAVRGRALVRFHGELSLALVGIALAPALFALAAGNWPFAAGAGAIAVALTVMGLLSRRLRGPRRLQSNEALVIVAVSYLLIAALMSLPMRDGGLPPLDAFFHAMSAVTTTGLSTAGSVATRSSSFLFAQAWMQWYGGLVVVVLAVLLMGPGAPARRLSAAEQDEADLAAGTRARARWALAVYAALTAAGFVILMLLGGDWFESMLNALAGVSTGGFSIRDDSLATLDSRVLQSGVMLLALAGAIPFARYRALAAKRPPRAGRLREFFDRETRVLLLLCVLAAALLAASMVLGGTRWAEAAWNAPLLAVSAQSTAGFTPVDVAGLDDRSKLILIASMFIGGGQGSTAGGIKVLRLLLLLRLVQTFLLRPALPPHAVVKEQLGERRLDEVFIRQAFGVVAVFSGVVLASWSAFVLLGHDPLDSLFEVVSATGTVGLSAGLAAPGLAAGLKMVLCLDMWMGRLEILAALVLLHPRTWTGRRAASP